MGSRILAWLRRLLGRGPPRTSRVDPEYLCQIGRCSHAPGECAWRM